MVEMDDLDVIMTNEISSQFEALAGMVPGTDEHAKAVEDLVKLYKAYTDKVGRENEISLKYEQMVKELEQKQKQLEADNKNRKLERIGTVVQTAACVAVPVIMGCSAMSMEQNGYGFSTLVGRNVMNQITKFPTFKIGK